jgi:hypothetical protein
MRRLLPRVTGRVKPAPSLGVRAPLLALHEATRNRLCRRCGR